MSDSPTVYLNGRYLPLNEAQVSVLDRGFLFGDGVYEVIPVYAGRPFRAEHHLARLDQSLASIRLENPLDHAAWLGLMEQLISLHHGGDQQIYLQITRGAMARRSHSFPAHPQPTVFVMSTPLERVSPELHTHGIAAITVEDIRWAWCNIKTINLLPNILLHQQALDAGAGEAILLRDGEVTEGSSSNLFVLIDGEIRTPPKSHLLLPGVTRDLLVELCRSHAIPCAERAISLAELRRAEEIWLSSSTRELVAITHLDGVAVGEGRPGPLWRRCLDLYHSCLRDIRAGQTH